MTFDKFSIKIVARVFLLLGNVFVFSYLWFNYENLLFVFILLATALVIQIWELIHFTQHTNRQLTKFLEALKHDDYSVTFGGASLGKSFSNLKEGFTVLIDRLKDNRAHQHGHSELLKLVLESVKIGVIVLEKSGEIVLMNPPALSMLEVPQFHNWEMFRKKKPEFARQLGDFDFEGRKLISVGTRDFYLDLDHITLMGQVYHIVSFSDLKNEIEQKEIEAWHKLIVILAHEVMNSITPISSLSETVQQMLTDEKGDTLNVEDISQEQVEDILEALKTIVRRSRGMLSFVQEYRKLTKLPAPNFELINIKSFLEEVAQLMQSQANQKGINIEVDVIQPKLALKADRKMIEQVIINLVGNAIYALENTEEPLIKIRARLTEDYTIIDVSDNGKGIPKEIITSIFIPFFSTRKNGSGIGLTLSKNIMKLHHGSITVESTLGEGTNFRLAFK